MADIKIKIKLNAGVEGDIIDMSQTTFSQNTNNVSKSAGSITTKNSGQKLISWANGKLSLSDGYVGGINSTLGKQNGYNGFVFGVVPENKQYSVEITLIGSNIDSVTFYGDRTANQFPTRAYLNGDTSNYIYSDDPEWSILFPNVSSTQTITFDMWNRANYNACLTHIGIFVNELVLDKTSIKNVESLSQSTDRPNEIFYGILPNSGSLSILDRNGEILDYIKSGFITNANLPVTIYTNNNEIQSHIINDSNYDTKSFVLQTSLSNILEFWDTFNYQGYAYQEGKTATAYELLANVLSTINYTQTEIDLMLDTIIIYGNKNTEGTVKSYLESIIIPYPYLEQDTIRNTIEKFCNLAQLQVYINDNNEIKFVSGRPIMTSNEKENTIVVPAKNQTQPFTENKILKNKYELVEISGKKVNVSLDNDSLVASFNSANQKIGYIETTKTNVETSQGNVYNTSLTVFYYYGNIIIPKTNSNGLEIVKNVYTGEDDNNEPAIKHEVRYEHYVGTLKENSEGNLEPDFTEIKEGSGVIATFDKFTYDYGGLAKVELNDETNLKTTIAEENVDSYNINFKIAVGWRGRGTFTDKNNILNKGIIEVYAPLSLEISVYGVKKIISFEDISVGDTVTLNNKVVASINGNELLQDNTKFNDIKISQIIKDNIKNDYKNGISSSNSSITCNNYYTTNNILYKNWQNGEIVSVGDIIRIDKDNNGNSQSVYDNGDPKYWKVTGRTFRKQGVPLVDLELQEVKL